VCVCVCSCQVIVQYVLEAGRREPWPGCGVPYYWSLSSWKSKEIRALKGILMLLLLRAPWQSVNVLGVGVQSVCVPGKKRQLDKGLSMRHSNSVIYSCVRWIFSFFFFNFENWKSDFCLSDIISWGLPPSSSFKCNWIRLRHWKHRCINTRYNPYFPSTFSNLL